MQGSTLQSKRYLGLLAVAALVGVVVSLAAWGFLRLVTLLQEGVYTDLPGELGFDHAPLWWSLPVCALAGLPVALAIAWLPGRGGHVPAHGLSAGVTQPRELPGVVLAGLASVGLGLVLGPEGPLIALGGGLGLLAARLARADANADAAAVLSAAGAFAALSLIFQSPLIAAVILIEVTGLGGPRLPLVLLPGLMAAGIGSLISIGMGSWTGLSTSDYALGVLPVGDFARPDASDFAWTVPLAVAIALGCVVVFRLARVAERLTQRRPFLGVPAAGLVVAGLAIAFTEATDKGVDEVLFSGQDQVGGLIANAGAWSLGALALLLLLKGIAWCICLGSFRGGPTFPAMFLGAAAGLMAGQLPGFADTPAVAVGIGAAVVAVLGTPLSAVLFATVLTASTAPGAAPLIILGVVAAYLTSKAAAGRLAPEPAPAPGRQGPAAETPSPAVAAPS